MGSEMCIRDRADPDHELIRFGARDYQPSTARWTAKDPIFFPIGLNLYGYVGNDALNATDRAGLRKDGCGKSKARPRRLSPDDFNIFAAWEAEAKAKKRAAEARERAATRKQLDYLEEYKRSHAGQATRAIPGHAIPKRNSRRHRNSQGRWEEHPKTRPRRVTKVDAPSISAILHSTTCPRILDRPCSSMATTGDQRIRLITESPRL